MTTTYRPPSQVMKLPRLGAFHQTRLSFVRSLLRKVMSEKWQIERTVWDLNSDGFGTAIYTVTVPIAPEPEIYSVVFFSNYIPDEKRTDRVIAEEWDVAFVLCEGVVTSLQVEELRANVPKQEVGRYLPYVLVLSRANKSTRNFATVLDSLSQGIQPDPAKLAKVGYLYRTTAVYGNGKFGVADFAKLQRSKSFDVTFRAQMFAVFMVRQFSIEQANYLAKVRNPAGAVDLDERIARYLGVGNATGLGMAPFIVSHPAILHQWVSTRERAIALVLSDGEMTLAISDRFKQLVAQAHQHVAEIETIHELQKSRNETMLQELEALINSKLATLPDFSGQTWHDVLGWVKDYSEETQEVIHSVMLELYPELINPLAEELNVEELFDLRPEMLLSELKTIITKNYSWALSIDFTQKPNAQWFWYSSADKEEPRLGNRFEEPGQEKERPLTIGRDITCLYAGINNFLDHSPAAAVIDFLMAQPSERGLIRRIQSLADLPYGEIQENLIGENCLPIDMLRCKLSFFGASKFDPRSNLWVRITLFQGAPLVQDIGKPFADDWFWPVAPKLPEDAA
ncbi:MAG: hypothetical protein AB8G95_07400 [Anaerolineae bacterium]